MSRLLVPLALAAGCGAPKVLSTVVGGPIAWPAVTIGDPGELYSTPDLGSEQAAIDCLRAQGFADDAVREVVRLSDEYAWPARARDLDQRIENAGIVGAYRVHQVCAFDGKALLVATPAENGHQPTGWRPTEDMWLVIAANGVK